MKTRILKYIAGAALVLAGLWTPFYIGMSVLPHGWLDHAGDWWWVIPAVVTLIISAVFVILSGIYIIVPADI
jgi:hypothetical protein